MTQETVTLSDFAYGANLRGLIMMKTEQLGYTLADFERLLEDQLDHIFRSVDETLERVIYDAFVEALGPPSGVDDPFLATIANLAVEENLNPDGTSKFESAQGYACAISALRIATQSSGPELRARIMGMISDATTEKVETEEEEVKPEPMDKVYRAMFDTVAAKYGAKEASRQLMEFHAEKDGVIDITDSSISEDQINRYVSEIKAIVPEFCSPTA